MTPRVPGDSDFTASEWRGNGPDRGREGKGAANSGRKGANEALTSYYHIHEGFANSNVTGPNETFTLYHGHKGFINKKQKWP